MAYPPLNNATTKDAYVPATTLSCADARRVNLDVTNAAVFYQLGHGSPPQWDPEVFLAPKYLSLDPLPGDASVCDAVRVRSAIAGVPAQVTVQPR